MNYPTFLKEVDAAVSRGSKEQLSAFIHEIARTLPEEGRRGFLDTLGSYLSAQAEAKKERKENLDAEIKAVVEELDEIISGERMLGSEYNEMWDDWDDDAEDEIIFHDPEEILPDIKHALSLMYKALDREEYRAGAVLAEKLSELRVEVGGDYYGDPLSIADLIYYNLVSGDIDTIVRNALYLEYMGNEEAERAGAMVRIMCSFRHYSITLESLLETARDEMDVSSLLPSWIEALAERNAEDVDKLLEEAVSMLGDSASVLDYASRYASSHPVIYRNILKNGKEKDFPMPLLDIGLKAIDEIPVDGKIRDEVCLLTASLAVREGKKEIMEKCWFEAFRSKPGVVNYLRLRLLSSSWKSISEKVERIYREHCRSSSFFSEKEPFAAMLFFDMHFDEVVEKFMNPKEGLGWSYTFMKPGIAFFLMLLSDGARGKGMEDMLSLARTASSFSAAAFTAGTDEKKGADDKVLFSECFGMWKRDVHLDEETASKILDRLEKWIDLRISAIMDANKRKYYDECASFIAALGEVVESRGTAGGKEMIMQGYREKYNRRHSFHDSLRRYGMRR